MQAGLIRTPRGPKNNFARIAGDLDEIFDIDEIAVSYLTWRRGHRYAPLTEFSGLVEASIEGCNSSAEDSPQCAIAS